jgi:hydrogenase nickel incorporation protein HypA/HybF
MLFSCLDPARITDFRMEISKIFCKYNAIQSICQRPPKPGIQYPMHELSLAAGLLDIIREEMKKHGASRLLLARVRVGALAGVFHGAMSLAFEALTRNTDLDGARLELDEEAVLLACGECGGEFSPDHGCPVLSAVCPRCARDAGHRLLAGTSLYLEHLEME